MTDTLSAGGVSCRFKVRPKAGDRLFGLITFDEHEAGRETRRLAFIGRVVRVVDSDSEICNVALSFENRRVF